MSAPARRSAVIGCALLGYLTPFGIGGLITSVRVRVYEGSLRSSLAMSWPMKPAAPVMRMCMVCCDEERPLE